MTRIKFVNRASGLFEFLVFSVILIMFLKHGFPDDIKVLLVSLVHFDVISGFHQLVIVGVKYSIILN